MCVVAWGGREQRACRLARQNDPLKPPLRPGIATQPPPPPPAVHPSPLQAQVAVVDLNNDGRLELVAGDARGNLAAFDADGREVWETHLASQIHQVRVCGWVIGKIGWVV